MFVTHRLPRIHSHFLFSPLKLKSPSPHKLYLITSTLLSKPESEPATISTALVSPLSHFSTLTSAAAVSPPPPLEQESPQLSLDTLFVPPETDISSLKNAPLNARILKGSNIVLGKYAGHGVEVVNAEFVKSSVKTEDCPADGIPEFALVGRSNVGKSSLLNSLVRRKRLALTSKKPGKHNASTIFVSTIAGTWSIYQDMAAPHEVRTDWAKFTKDYFLTRPSLVSVFLLIDASIPAKKIDLDYASWLGENQTEKEKERREKAEENVQNFQELIREFFQTAPPWIMTSSVTNQGRDEILLHMSQLRNYWLKH